MKTRIEVCFLLALFAGLTGGLLSCKSKPPSSPSASAAPAKAPAQDGVLAIADGDRVTIEHSITKLPDNKIVDSSVGKEPLTFTQGKHEILPAIENALVGMKVGERKLIPLTYDQAFGPYDETAKETVKRIQIPPNAKVGDMVKKKDGKVATIVELSDESALLDFNHPLAGKNIIYGVTVLKIERP